MKPQFAVHLDGKKLEGEEQAAILAIRVYQTRMGASSFELVVSDKDLKWQDAPTFTECKEVKIELGVPGKLKTVFDGEVTAWRTELERSGPTVLVVRGLDRAHRMMRAQKTKTYTEATPLDCVQQIAGNYGLTAKTRAGSPEPVKMFRFQANQTDFEFLRGMADLEGYLFWIDGKDLHFERPQLSDTDDCEFSFGEDLETFLPTANFRRPAVSVEVGAWDTSGKAEITGKAKTGDELWTVPGGKPGAKQAKFTSTKTELSLVESQVATQAHADTVARAALTRRAMEFLTAEVEVQGNPEVKPGALVNLKNVGPYSGHYLVTEANHFYDAGGYHCIFYVARDKWGDSSNQKEKEKQERAQSGAQGRGSEAPYQPPKGPAAEETKQPVDFTLHDVHGKGLAGVKVKLHFAGGEVIDAVTDGQGKVHLDEAPPGSYTVEVPGAGASLTEIRVRVEDPEGNPVTGASGKVAFADGSEVAVMTDVKGEVHLTDVPEGEYTLTLDADDRGPPEEREEPEPEEQEQEKQPEAGEEQDAPEPEATPSLLGAFEAAHFETAKALPLPGAIPVFRGIAKLLEKEPSRVLLVAGHTDSVGTPVRNLRLSDDRAQAVAAFLRDDAEAWMRFYGHPESSARWGVREDQIMLSALPYGGTPWYEGEIDGDAGPMTRAALRELQETAGLPATGKADDATRRALIRAYLQADGTSIPSADIRTLGCGDRHRIEKTQGASEQNRRVDVFAFESGEIVPSPDDCREGKHPGCKVYDRWKKAVTGEIGRGKADEKPKEDDLIPQARKLHKAYLDARDEYVRWGAEKERSAARYVGEWCEALAKEKDFRERIDTAALQRDKQARENEAKERCEEIERRAKELTEFLGSPKLQRQLRRKGAAGMREGASLIQGVGECVTGGTWIERQLQGEEGLLSWLLSKEGAEQAAGGAEAVKKSWEVLEPVLDALAETAGTVTRLKRTQAVEYIAQIVAARFQLRVADLITRQVVEIRGGMVAAVVYRREVTILTPTQLLSHATVKSVGHALEALGRVVAVVNFAAKLDLLAQDPSLRNSVSAVGALAELLDTSETAVSFTRKLLRSGRELAEDGAPKAIEAAAEAGEVAGTAGRTFLKFLGEGVAKKLTPLAVVAGVADAVTGSSEAYEEADKGNYAGAAAKAGVGVGGALLAIAGTMELTGLGADATIAGAPAGVVLGILGLVVGAVGGIASLFTGESELEVWAEHCLYGKRYGRDKYASWKGNLEAQIEALQEALYQVRVKGDLEQDVTQIEIEPTGITRASKMTCFVNASSDLTMETVRQELPLRDDQKDCEIEFGEGGQAAVVKKIKLRVDLPRHKDVIWSTLTLVFAVDPDGDGVAPLKRTAEVKQGVLDWVWSRL